MAADPGAELGVDVLIIGGGIMGHYLAQSLVPTYTVCLLSDPTIRVETTESEGYLSAGYEGNDANRIQPARRAAGYWKLWAESNAIANDYAPTYFLVPPEDEIARTRLWTDAALAYHREDRPPAVFEGGAAGSHLPYVTENDVIINPAHILNKLREGIEHCCLEGEVVKFIMASDQGIDYVEVDVRGELIPIVPRYTVLAASGGNAGLLSKVAVRTRDAEKRKERVETAKACQAVRKKYLLTARGADLPLVAGHVDGLEITAHPLTGTDEHIWLVSPPIDDSLTTLGQEDLRFEVPVDPKVVAVTVEKLFALSPEVERIAHRLQWGVYVRRKTEHPMMAVRDTSSVGQPAPAKIETLGIDGFMALWPSHLSYSMIVGDVASERIGEYLGAPGDFGDDLSVADLAADLEPFRSRWDRDDFPWHDWDAFAKSHDIT
ncbi:MAG: FAD-binding oxidoreductase [Acidimicrobiales bacterium]|nr:FAD-binding oxidoreductase [Acidimicrobiales bacterium]